MKRNEIKQTAELYFKNKTFVHIQERHPSGTIKWYNGYIIKIYDDFLTFQDRKIALSFPILYEAIVIFEPSEVGVE